MMKYSFKSLIMATIIASALASCGNSNTAETSNPFFIEYNTPFHVPPFDKIKPEHFMPAFERGMEEGRNDLQKIIDNPESPTFENTIAAYDQTGRLLNKVSSAFYELASTNTNDQIKQLEVELSPLLSAYSDDISLNPKLFERIKSVYLNRDNENLTDEQNYILENIYKSFVREGANLSDADKEKLKDYNSRLSLLCVQFEQNVLNETNSYKMFIDRQKAEDLPESVITGAMEAAKETGKEGSLLFTTHRPSMYPFLTYSKNRTLREELYHAYTDRCNRGNAYDNNDIFEQIIAIRAEKAKLLGYKTHADLVLDSRMAQNQKAVYKLLNSIWDKALAVAKQEVAEMQEIIKKEGGDFELKDYDWWYYSEKLRKEKYDLNDNELRPYFTLENAKKGLFEVVNRLFGITYTPITNIPKPHPDAEAYEVKEADGTHLGIVYFDYFPRDSKSQGAWCSTIESHHFEDGREIPAIVSTVYNFTKPAGKDPALLSLDEVKTLFHESGHSLDAMMNKNRYNTKFIPWDFVELPSQILEHWAVEPEVLKIYAKHYKTGEIIPDELIDKITKSAFFNQGFENVELIAASLLDMAYYTLEAPLDINVQEFEKNYLKSIGLIPEIRPRYRTTYFLHIINGYDAGYYNYTWAAVLDNDGFEAFRENGIFDKATAESYRKNILEKNGIMDPRIQYRNFRGHDADITALLKNRGLQ